MGSVGKAGTIALVGGLAGAAAALAALYVSGSLANADGHVSGGEFAGVATTTIAAGAAGTFGVAYYVTGNTKAAALATGASVAAGLLANTIAAGSVPVSFAARVAAIYMVLQR